MYFSAVCDSALHEFGLILPLGFGFTDFLSTSLYLVSGWMLTVWRNTKCDRVRALIYLRFKKLRPLVLLIQVKKIMKHWWNNTEREESKMLLEEHNPVLKYSKHFGKKNCYLRVILDTVPTNFPVRNYFPSIFQDFCLSSIFSFILYSWTN